MNTKLKTMIAVAALSVFTAIAMATVTPIPNGKVVDGDLNVDGYGLTNVGTIQLKSQTVAIPTGGTITNLSPVTVLKLTTATSQTNLNQVFGMVAGQLVIVQNTGTNTMYFIHSDGKLNTTSGATTSLATGGTKFGWAVNATNLWLD